LFGGKEEHYGDLYVMTVGETAETRARYVTKDHQTLYSFGFAVFVNGTSADQVATVNINKPQVKPSLNKLKCCL